MAPDIPHIDTYLFECQLKAFTKFIEKQPESGKPFESFKSDSYIEQHEGYKFKVYKDGYDELDLKAWKRSSIGSGEIAQKAANALDIQGNNLVDWRIKQQFREVIKQQDVLPKLEGCLFELYREKQDERSFDELVNISGKNYPLIAYLFFLKDCTEYLPIAPQHFDYAFELLGAEFKTSHKCSWENYQLYISLIRELRIMLAENLDPEATLLDAHSFAWILAGQMREKNETADTQMYRNLSASERDAIVKVRIGQGKFRQDLIKYWSECAVTGCKEKSLLVASHIKPWRKASLDECRDPYNGLLLSPALDACFDSGYVSFDDEGKIWISKKLTADDAEALGISSKMRLRHIDPKHKQYLAFHWKHIRKDENP